MTTARNELPPVSWDDLLLAISPQRGIANTEVRRFIEAVTVAQQEGRITDEDVEELIKVMVAAAVSGRVNAIVGDFFTPDAHGRLGVRSGRVGFHRPGHGFSLI